MLTALISSLALRNSSQMFCTRLRTAVVTELFTYLQSRSGLWYKRLGTMMHMQGHSVSGWF